MTTLKSIHSGNQLSKFSWNKLVKWVSFQYKIFRLQNPFHNEKAFEQTNINQVNVLNFFDLLNFGLFLAFLQPSIIILLQRWLLREEAPFLIRRLNIFELQTRSSTHGWILVKCPISFIILTKTYFFPHAYVFISWKRNHRAKWKVLTLKYEVHFTWLFLYSSSLLLMRNLARLLL